MRFVSSLILLGLLMWGGGALLGVFIESFSGASDTVKAAAIAAFVTVITFIIGRYFEQTRENKAKANVEKIRVYEMFFDLYFTIFGNKEIVGSNDDPDWIAKQLFSFQKELVLWGSDKVLKSYFEFRQELTVFEGIESSDDEILVDKLSRTITAAAKLLKSMRQDIGYPFTSFSPVNLAILQLRNDEPQFPALIKALTSK